MKRRIEKKKHEDELDNELKSKQKLNSIDYLRKKGIEIEADKVEKIDKIGRK